MLHLYGHEQADCDLKIVGLTQENLQIDISTKITLGDLEDKFNIHTYMITCSKQHLPESEIIEIPDGDKQGDTFSVLMGSKPCTTKFGITTIIETEM